MSEKDEKENLLPDGSKLQVGQIYIDEDGKYYRIKKITSSGDPVCDIYENGKWRQYSQIDKESFNRERYILVESVQKAYEIKAMVLEHKNTLMGDVSENTEEKQLASITTKEMAQRMIDELEQNRMLVEIASRVIKAEMEKMERELSAIMSKMMDKMGKIQRVIDLFELYLGVSAEIVQIREGKTSDSPIHFHQLYLHMDEEAGILTRKNGQKGIDFSRVEEFDDWCRIPENTARVIPEEKGLVVLYPTRQDRHYSDSSIVDARMRAKNAIAYILIRNGDNLYRIYTDTTMGRMLFPAKEYNLDDEKSWGKKLSEDKNELYIYRRNAMILQGLIDRTEVFKPLSEKRINLFDPKSYNDKIVFVRDAEFVLPDGRLSFSDWHEKINKSIGPGSRIFLFPRSFWETFKCGKFEAQNRYLYYANEYTYPELPLDGVYQVSLTDSEFCDYDYEDVPGKNYKRKIDVYRRVLRIKYKPNDIVYSTGWEYDPHERKNNVSFRIYKDDRFVINADQVDEDDIEYYINNRLERRNYLSILPLLYGIKEFLASEREKEYHFIELVANKCSVSKEIVQEAVDWWKFKNKWKRSVRDDDEKAYRMIVKRIENGKID